MPKRYVPTYRKSNGIHFDRARASAQRDFQLAAEEPAQSLPRWLIGATLLALVLFGWLAK